MCPKASGSKLDDAFEKLSELINRIHARVNAQNVFSPEVLRKARMILGVLPLLEEEAEEFSDAVAMIYELMAAKREHVSLSATESLIQATVVDSVDVNKSSQERDFNRRLTAAIAALRTALSQEPGDWTVYHEVRGLAPDGLPFKVGNVEFCLVDDYLGAAIRSSKIRDVVEPLAKGRTYGKVTVQAQDYGAANLVALKQLRLAVDVVNFFTDVFGGAYQFLFLPGDREMTHTTSFMLQESRLSHTSSTNSGPLAPTYLGYINEKRAHRSGFDRVSLLLGAKNRSALEDRLLASVQWAGRAAVEQRGEEAFLLFIIALESLLLKKDIVAELRFRFALNGSHLLVTKLDVRKRVFDDLTKAYDKRSQIVHSGSTQVAITELRRIHTYVRDAILAVLLNPVFIEMDEDQFDNWFKERALGSAEESATSN